jgi:DNA-binding transcriptional ArsR family regulator
MKRTTAVAVFESLASGVRLDTYRLLVRKGPAGLVAGDIAAALDLPATNVSFHLKALTRRVDGGGAGGTVPALPS